MQYEFIWKVKGREVEREPARNCYVRDIQQKKYDLAISHDCKYYDISMIYQEKE